MSLTDVLTATTLTGFSTAEEALIEAAITNTYNNSTTAQTMYDDWVDAGNTISISNVPGVFQAFRGTGRVEIDIPYIGNLYFIDDNGNAVQYPFELALVHEFVHALEGLADNYDAPDGDYRGDTVTFTNDIHAELGYVNRNSYIGTNFDTVITPNTAYTGGAAIDRSFAADASWSSTGNIVKGTAFADDLLIGGASANSLEGNLGDDFLFGGGGDDFLNGGIGGTDTVILSGRPVDYDIRLNPDGTWTSDHVRGTMDEGMDIFQNLERLSFLETGDTFNLNQSGLTWQTDFAFVIDQTGSMRDDIAAVRAAASGVVNALFADATIDARIGIVGYRDNTIGEPTTVVLPFTDQDDFAQRQTAAVDAINGLTVSGGGDFAETAFDGLLTALDGSMGEWRVGAGVKKVALFTDASAKDANLLPTVLSYALSIGATVTASASASFGEIASVDSFELTFGEASGVFPEAEGETLPGYEPSGDPIEAPGGTAIVQITTIFIDTFITPDPDFVEVSAETGGSVIQVSTPAEVVEALLGVITTTNYNLTVDRAIVAEGDSGMTEITYTISRDRVDTAATVTLERTGDATDADVTGFPTSIEFAAGDVTQTFTVSIVGDTVEEPDVTFGLRIADVTGDAFFPSAPTTILIKDDDAVATTDFAVDDAYVFTESTLDAQGTSWFRLGAVQFGTTLLENDTVDTPIAFVNGAAIEEGVWFDGDGGGQFRVFEGGVIDFRNRGDAISAGDSTGFSYSLVDGGETDTADVVVTVEEDTDPARDDGFSVSSADLDAAGRFWFRLGALDDDTDLLENDIGVDEILFVNGRPIREGVWFDGDGGGQFRVFSGGVVDFRNQGDEIGAGDSASFTYAVLEDGVLDGATVSMTVEIV